MENVDQVVGYRTECLELKTKPDTTGEQYSQDNPSVRWFGHGGYGGQFMLADPDTEIAISFFSVLEDRHAFTDDYLPEVTQCFEEIIQLYSNIYRSIEKRTKSYNKVFIWETSLFVW